LRHIFLALNLFFASSLVYSAQVWDLYNFKVQPGRAPAVLKAFNDLQTSEAGSNRIASVHLQQSVFGGSSGTTHSIVALYPSRAEFERARRALAGASFADEAAFAAARLEMLELAKLATTIREFDDDKLKAQQIHDSLRLELQDQAPPAIEALAQARQAAATVLSEAQETFQALDRQLRQLKEVDAAITKLVRSQQALEDDYKLIGTLSQVANGKNPLNMSLQRFVLSVILDEVLIAAGERLGHMSKGRYTLLRRTEVTGAQKSGLELDVEDAYTGKTRAVSTLSGGESFIAALSLALGLSAVVQSHSGGIRLDTLFIDEGFGSLDPESLDLAITTLIDLQQAGRMVGVISHVPELKERIDVRVDVVVGRAGSSVTVGGVDAA
jgi:DNA repair protein SbcC/Rad50